MSNDEAKEKPFEELAGWREAVALGDIFGRGLWVDRRKKGRKGNKQLTLNRQHQQASQVSEGSG